MVIVNKGDRGILYWKDSKSAPFPIDDVVKVHGLGVIDLAACIGGPWGANIKVGSREFTLLKADLIDDISSIERGAQIITQKDSPKIAHLAGVRPGSKVLEAGAGSGGLTLVLCTMVGPTGKVITYDINEKNLTLTRKNIQRAGLSDRWVGKIGDAREGFEENDADAFVMDIPDAAVAVEKAKEAVVPGGRFVAYCPLIGQVSDVSKEMERLGFFEVTVIEIIERDWVVHDRGSRPDFAKLGHTGFIVSGRKGA